MVSENVLAGDGVEMAEMAPLPTDEGMVDVEIDNEEEDNQLGGLVPGGGRQRSDSGAMDLRETIDIWTWDNCGYLMQYFAVGLIYGEAHFRFSYCVLLSCRALNSHCQRYISSMSVHTAARLLCFRMRTMTAAFLEPLH